jgi:hypothetical protein
MKEREHVPEAPRRFGSSAFRSPHIPALLLLLAGAIQAVLILWLTWVFGPLAWARMPSAIAFVIVCWWLAHSVAHDRHLLVAGAFSGVLAMGAFGLIMLGLASGFAFFPICIGVLYAILLTPASVMLVGRHLEGKNGKANDESDPGRSRTLPLRPPTHALKIAALLLLVTGIFHAAIVVVAVWRRQDFGFWAISVPQAVGFVILMTWLARAVVRQRRILLAGVLSGVFAVAMVGGIILGIVYGFPWIVLLVLSGYAGMLTPASILLIARYARDKELEASREPPRM